MVNCTAVSVHAKAEIVRAPRFLRHDHQHDKVIKARTVRVVMSISICVPGVAMEIVAQLLDTAANQFITVLNLWGGKVNTLMILRQMN